MNSSSLQTINHSSGFKYFDVRANDIKIQSKYIQDFDILWDGNFVITGYMDTNDHIDIINTAKLKVNSKIIVTCIDLYEVNFAREFIITEVLEQKTQGLKGVRFEFQDIISYTLQNTYIDKSYEITSLTDIFNEYMALEVDALISGFPIEKQLLKSRELTNFVVPNKNFLEFITLELKKEGLFFYQDKTKIVIGDADFPLIDDGEFAYIQAGTQELYGYKIIDYHLVLNNYKVNILPKTDYHVFDKSKKSMTHYTKNYSDYKEDFNLNGITTDLQVTNGSRNITKEYLVDDTKYRYTDYKDANIMTIVVPGNFTQSLLYSRVEVELAGNHLTTETLNKGDQKLSGTYQICEVNDKIYLGQRFIQQLKLRRINDGKEL